MLPEAVEQLPTAQERSLNEKVHDPAAPRLVLCCQGGELRRVDQMLTRKNFSQSLLQRLIQCISSDYSPFRKGKGDDLIASLDCKNAGLALPPDRP
jgi:hypothetical protein